MSLQAEVARSRSPTATSIDLRRLLDRLQHTLLSPGADRHLRKSSYQRTKVGANLDYARTLVLRLERDAPAASRTTISKVQIDESRALLKQLQDRLAELNEPSSSTADASSDSASDTEDLASRYAPAVTTESAGLDSENTPQPSNTRTLAAAANISSTLRARQPQAAAPQDPATTSSHAASGAPQPRQNTQSTSPFAPAPAPAPAEASTDALMNHHSDEQNALTDSLLSLAGALKAASLSFSDAVTGSNSLVDRTAAALDKSVGGMEKAGSRMGMLKRMTEGRGWWARLSLYAYIGILWVVALTVVFILPKLRF